MKNYELLRKKIESRYRRNSDLAKELGISEQSLCAKLNGKVSFSQNEMEKLLELLNIKDREIRNTFFSNNKVEK